MSNAAEAQLLRLAPTGEVSVVVKGLAGPRALALAPPGSPFGDALYVATRGTVQRVEVDGRTSVLVEGLITPSALAFGPGGALGNELYLTDGGLAGGRLLRVSPAGVVTPVADGFGVLSAVAMATDPPFGPAIFVADYVTHIIYRLTPVRP